VAPGLKNYRTRYHFDARSVSSFPRFAVVDFRLLQILAIMCPNTPSSTTVSESGSQDATLTKVSSSDTSQE
jgi:hypothetical protein